MKNKTNKAIWILETNSKYCFSSFFDNISNELVKKKYYDFTLNIKRLENT